MQGKGILLRLGLLALVVVLVLSAVGSLSLARDAFDGNDYDDCPAATRLDSVNGLAVDRTDEEDEIRISWDALSDAALSSLGPNGYRARLTVIVEGSGSDIKNNVALGDTSLVVDEVEYTTDLTVSVAITLGDFVISDIAEKDFTSGMPAPEFSTALKMAGTTPDDATAAVLATDGWVAGDQRNSFYYLGFNDLFDNWFVASNTVTDGIRTKPSTAKFRVGLAHGDGDASPADADFENYRIVIEDSSGDLLGYQAQTVSGKNTYGGNKIVIGAGTTLLSAANMTDDGVDDQDNTADDVYHGFTNIRLSNQVTGDSALSPYYGAAITDALRITALDTPDGDLVGISYGNVNRNIDDDDEDFLAAGVLFAEPPVEYFDFPDDVFEDDGSYVIKAWAEDDDGTRISPVASVELSVREGDPVNSTYKGYAVTAGVDGAAATVANFRNWTGSAEAVLSVHGLSIQDE